MGRAIEPLGNGESMDFVFNDNFQSAWIEVGGVLLWIRPIDFNRVEIQAFAGNDAEQDPFDVWTATPKKY
jgi:hypothetical protein